MIILFKACDLVRKANLLLHTFSAADPLVKSCLFKFYCLSLYSCSLWNLLRCIWNLQHNCRTGILHVTALLPSIFNMVQSQSSTLLSCALSSPSYVVRQFFVTPVCWIILKLGLIPCLVNNLQSHIITNMASVLKLSVIFVFMETHQRSMT